MSQPKDSGKDGIPTGPGSTGQPVSRIFERHMLHTVHKSLTHVVAVKNNQVQEVPGSVAPQHQQQHQQHHQQHHQQQQQQQQQRQQHGQQQHVGGGLPNGSLRQLAFLPGSMNQSPSNKAPSDSATSSSSSGGRLPHKSDPKIMDGKAKTSSEKRTKTYNEDAMVKIRNLLLPYDKKGASSTSSTPAASTPSVSEAHTRVSSVDEDDPPEPFQRRPIRPINGKSHGPGSILPNRPGMRKANPAAAMSSEDSRMQQQQQQQQRAAVSHSSSAAPSPSPNTATYINIDTASSLQQLQLRDKAASPPPPLPPRMNRVPPPPLPPRESDVPATHGIGGQFPPSSYSGVVPYSNIPRSAQAGHSPGSAKGSSTPHAAIGQPGSGFLGSSGNRGDAEDMHLQQQQMQANQNHWGGPGGQGPSSSPVVWPQQQYAQQQQQQQHGQPMRAHPSHYQPAAGPNSPASRGNGAGQVPMYGPSSASQAAAGSTRASGAPPPPYRYPVGSGASSVTSNSSSTDHQAAAAAALGYKNGLDYTPAQYGLSAMGSMQQQPGGVGGLDATDGGVYRPSPPFDAHSSGSSSPASCGTNLPSGSAPSVASSVTGPGSLGSYQVYLPGGGVNAYRGPPMASGNSSPALPSPASLGGAGGTPQWGVPVPVTAREATQPPIIEHAVFSTQVPKPQAQTAFSPLMPNGGPPPPYMNSPAGSQAMSATPPPAYSNPAINGSRGNVHITLRREQDGGVGGGSVAHPGSVTVVRKGSLGADSTGSRANAATNHSGAANSSGGRSTPSSHSSRVTPQSHLHPHHHALGAADHPAVSTASSENSAPSIGLPEHAGGGDSRPPPPYPFKNRPGDAAAAMAAAAVVSAASAVSAATTAGASTASGASQPAAPGGAQGGPESEMSESEGETRRCTSPIDLAQAENRNREEYKLRHLPPQAFKFYMEQHMENVLKECKNRLKRRAQLEMEMDKAGLCEEAKEEMRKMLIQKESNYLRQKRSKLQIDMFHKIRVIGLGAFGEVSLVRKIVGGNTLYAMKTLRKSDVLRKNQMAHVKAERDILAEANNEWLVKLYFTFQDETNLYFIMEYIPGGDLMNLLIKLEIFSEHLARFYIAELVLAIDSVHNMGFLHRDIKPDNILIDKDGHIKLTDFGLCTGFHWTHNSIYYQNAPHGHGRQDSMDPSSAEWNCNCREHKHNPSNHTSKPLERRKRRGEKNRCVAHSLVGTPNYIAPEVLLRKGYTRTCDWWPVGVILYEMLVGRPPFLASSTTETQHKVINWETELRFPQEANLSESAKDIIMKLCTHDTNRLGKTGARDIKNHPFFAPIEFDGLRQRKAPYTPTLSSADDTSHFDQVPESELHQNRGPPEPVGQHHHHHGFYEFTFKRFFDDGGVPLPLRVPGDNGEWSGPGLSLPTFNLSQVDEVPPDSTSSGGASSTASTAVPASAASKDAAAMTTATPQYKSAQLAAGAKTGTPPAACNTAGGVPIKMAAPSPGSTPNTPAGSAPSTSNNNNNNGAVALGDVTPGGVGAPTAAPGNRQAPMVSGLPVGSGPAPNDPVYV